MEADDERLRRIPGRMLTRRDRKAAQLRPKKSSTALVSEGVLAFLRCRNIDIYDVHKNVKFLRHLRAQSSFVDGGRTVEMGKNDEEKARGRGRTSI